MLKPSAFKVIYCYDIDCNLIACDRPASSPTTSVITPRPPVLY